MYPATFGNEEKTGLKLDRRRYTMQFQILPPPVLLQPVKLNFSHFLLGRYVFNGRSYVGDFLRKLGGFRHFITEIVIFTGCISNAA